MLEKKYFFNFNASPFAFLVRASFSLRISVIETLHSEQLLLEHAFGRHRDGVRAATFDGVKAV